jgi:hypothetical protein
MAIFTFLFETNKDEVILLRRLKLKGRFNIEPIIKNERTISFGKLLFTSLVVRSEPNEYIEKNNTNFNIKLNRI